jgi:uncharacterized protein YodC (DUF2158 family)
MTTPKFQINDSVRLKDGKIKMSINKAITEPDISLGQIFNGYYECVWEDDSKIKKDIIHQDLLISS